MARRQDIVIGSKRLYVRPWREEDLEPLRLIFGDPEVTRYTGDGRPWTGDRVARLVRWGIDNKIGHEPVFFNCPLIHRQGNIAIGRVGINPLGDEAGGVDESMPELEWTIAREYWGRGLGTEIGRSMIHYGFETAGFERLIAFAAPENKASLRVMQKIGMRFQKKMTFRGKDFVFYEISKGTDIAWESELSGEIH